MSEHINKTKVYFIEGLPGTGKTNISEWLSRKLNCDFTSEDSSNFPNNLYQIGGIPEHDFQNLCDRYVYLKEFAVKHGAFWYIHTDKVIEKYPSETELHNILFSWDIGEERNTSISSENYIASSLDIISTRINNLASDKAIVMDSVWLQNPINELLYRNITDTKIVVEYCHELITRLHNIIPICIYLKRNTPEDSVNEACRLKGDYWTDAVSRNLSTTPFCFSDVLNDKDIMMRFFVLRSQIECEVLKQSMLNTFQYTIEDNNWESIKEQIERDLKEMEI